MFAFRRLKKFFKRSNNARPSSTISSTIHHPHDHQPSSSASSSVLRITKAQTVNNLNDLHDHCLLLIFGLLPLSHLLGVINLVCRRWHSLQLTACSRVHSLVLLFNVETNNSHSDSGYSTYGSCNNNNNNNHNNSNSTLQFRKLTCEITVNLSTKFPRITVLAVIQHRIECCATPEFIYLLDRFSSLTKLHLYAHFSEPIRITNRFQDFLNFVYNNVHSLKLLTIELDQCVQSRFDHHRMVLNDSMTSSRITYRAPEFILDPSDLLKLSRQIKFLTILKMTCLEWIPIEQIASSLSPLQLIELHLTFYSPPEPVALLLYPKRFPKIKSLRCLSLKLATQSHLELGYLKLHRYFPNLETLSIDNRFRNCTDCEHTSSFVVSECIELGVRAMCSRCVKLVKVYSVQPILGVASLIWGNRRVRIVNRKL